MRRALLISFLLFAPAVHSQTAGAHASAGPRASEWDLVYQCSQSADEDVVGLAELEQVCPGLQAALSKLGYLAFLSEEQREELSVYSLEDLEYLGNRPVSATSVQPPVRAATLHSVLDSLEKEAAERPLSLLDRLENWIRELLRRRAQGESSWFDEWLEKVAPSEILVTATLYTLVGFVILLAILVLVNELRVAGVLRRRAGAKASAPAPGDVTEARATASLADLHRFPLAERPAALLRILVNALVSTGRLRSERSLTYRELTRRASFPDEGQRASFTRIATAAERSVYGRARIAEQELDSLVREGRELYERLAGRAG